jgi:hypothetical protein
MKRKHCPNCEEAKKISEFGVSKHRPDGRAGYCKECKREIMKLRRECSGETSFCDTTATVILTQEVHSSLRRIKAITGISIRKQALEALKKYCREKEKKLFKE